MTLYRPSRAYQPALDIRFGAGVPVPGWARPLVDGQASNCPAWLIVMPRRSGKTWLRHAIGTARPAITTTAVDLRVASDVRTKRLGCLTGGGAAPHLGPGALLLVDEPALGCGGVEPETLATGLARVRDTGATCAVFTTPAEHDLLLPHLGADAPKDVVRPPVLNGQECARMAARAPEWAPEFVELLRRTEPAWLATPFLLELALQTAESYPEHRADPGALLRTAAEVADDTHEYIRGWFHNGLGPGHRAVLRGTRWRAAGLQSPPDALSAGPLLEQDPVLARHLPEVLRVHHISDLHHGRYQRDDADARDTARTGRNAAVAGSGTPMDGYLDHIRQLAAVRRAPHLVVVTGDVVDRPRKEHGAKARAWLAELATLLAPHPDLRGQDPRVLLVGGNHDVSWDLAMDPSSQARHRWFAETFADYPHPGLHLADPAARRLYVDYPAAGLRFALLGSAESGGEAAQDPDRERLRAVLEQYEQYLAAGRARDDDTIACLVRDLERLDPGVVARGVLDRLAPQPGYVTVAALHHPLSPVPSVEAAPPAGVVNAGHAKRCLAAAATCLVLHGRTHLAFAAAERLLDTGRPWTMRIVGAPALAGRDAGERGGYNELFVAREGDGHTLAVRAVRQDGGQWTPGPEYAFTPGAAEEGAVWEACGD